MTALKNHLGLSELITERDAEALKFLCDIRVEYLDGRSGFKLLFDFAQGAQEFFENKTLEKTYVYQDEVGVGYCRRSFGIVLMLLVQNTYSMKAISFMIMLRERA